ncbi:MAG: hypothetical protein QOD77_806 [Thermoplasmata archaeon]|nr:hypothetical protein [Thermoplasmata archaeon]
MNKTIVLGIVLLMLGTLALVPSAAAQKPKPIDCTIHGPPRGTIVGEVLYMAGVAVEGACIIANLAADGSKETIDRTLDYADETVSRTRAMAMEVVHSWCVIVGLPC